MGSIGAGEVRRVPPPTGSLIDDWYLGADLLDSYAVRLPRGRESGMRALAEAALSDPPPWLTGLMRVRDGVVRPFGIKTADDFRRSSGAAARVDFFPVVAERPDEIVLGADDRHLDFRTSLLRRRNADGVEVVMTTSVRVNNMVGRIYLAAITPFHVVVVRSMLARLARADPG